MDARRNLGGRHADPGRLARTGGRAVPDLDRPRAQDGRPGCPRGAEPITADYKEPSLIVSLGRPAAPLLTRTWLIDQVGRHGKVVMALLSGELSRLRGDPKIEMRLSETVRGFNPSKGRVETLHLVVLRPATGPGMARGPRQQSLVK